MGRGSERDCGVASRTNALRLRNVRLCGRRCAARSCGTAPSAPLDDLEAVVVAAEGAKSQEEEANEVRRPEDDDAIELPGALRWLRRRVDLVHDVLSRVIGLIPDKLAGCAATMSAVRDKLKSNSALMALRGLVAGRGLASCGGDEGSRWSRPRSTGSRSMRRWSARGFEVMLVPARMTK